MSKRGMGLILFCIALAISLWLGLFSYRLWTFGHTDLAKPADSAIVLGTRVFGHKPGAVFEQRINHAINLYRDGVVGKIIFTGGLGDANRLHESIAARDYALRAGVPSSVIYTETRSGNTHENLIHAKQLMQAQDLQTAIIVSDPLHLKRAAIIAGKLNMRVVTSPTPTPHYRSPGARVEFLLRELVLCHRSLIFGY